ncbi:MAG: CDP-alcohol phosphatidyltransferase family protein [Candidatus Aminicenantes bacterium]|nr:CDP-alcohol phosphatidyltransferase family protein [Candidatus Aminicenantes bacterium]
MSNNKFVYKDSLKGKGKNYVFKYMNAEKYINRPLGSLIVRAVYKTRITPNHLTYSAFLISIPGIVFIALGGYLNVIIGGVLIYLSVVIDVADGMLARSRGSGSIFGKYLDLFLDRVSDFLILLALTINKFRMTGNKDWLIFGLFVLSLYMLQIILFYIKNLYLGRDTGTSGDARGLVGLVILVLALFNRIDILLYFSALEVAIVVPYRIIDFIYLGMKKNSR